VKTWKRRKSAREIAILFYDLVGSDRKFKKCWRMSYERFLRSLDISKPGLMKQNTSFREAVRLKERLAVRPKESLAVRPKERLAVCLKH
jgi:hypothetical protein